MTPSTAWGFAHFWGFSYLVLGFIVGLVFLFWFVVFFKVEKGIPSLFTSEGTSLNITLATQTDLSLVLWVNVVN